MMQVYQPFSSPSPSRSSSVKIIDEDDNIGGQSPTSTHMQTESAESSYIILNDSSNGVLLAQNKRFESTTALGKQPNHIRDSSTCLISTQRSGPKSTQEDRLLLAPEFFDQSLALCAVFDGACGDAASNFASKFLPNFLCNTSEMQSLITYCKFRKSYQIPADREMEFVAKLSEVALRKAFLSMDSVLLHHLKQGNLHFTSCTAVTAMVWENLLTIAHLGDSRACIFRENEQAGGYLQPEWLTIDHRPNHPLEQQRIYQSGGKVSWTNGKPFLTGPDFVQSYNNNDLPMKFNYSRGFGGKDLKSFGFSADPEIQHFEITSKDKFVVLATDGLWDVLPPTYVAQVITMAKANGLSVADELVKAALEEMPDQSLSDNVSVIVIGL